MKSLELKPTYKNLIDVYKNDTVGRRKDVVKFAEILDSIQ